MIGEAARDEAYDEVEEVGEKGGFGKDEAQEEKEAGALLGTLRALEEATSFHGEGVEDHHGSCTGVIEAALVPALDQCVCSHCQRSNDGLILKAQNFRSALACSLFTERPTETV